jgi:hypothetical protein
MEYAKNVRVKDGRDGDLINFSLSEKKAWVRFLERETGVLILEEFPMDDISILCPFCHGHGVVNRPEV